MRVVVLGAGMLGVSSAYYLQQLGHEVTVVDRHATPCAKARGLADLPSVSARPQTVRAPAFGRAGTAVSTLRRTARAQLGRLKGMFEAPRPDPVENLVRLGTYSRETVRALRDEAGVPHASSSPGVLTFYLDEQAFERLERRVPRLRTLGCETQLLSPDEAVQIEPALRPMSSQLVGATLMADDPARDPAVAANALVFLCRAAGVRFMSRYTVVALHEHEGRIDHVEIADPDGQPMALRAQAYVLALGTGSVEHADSLGIDMPLHLMRHYIITLPIQDTARAPHVGLHDHSGKLRIARIETPAGDCLRVSTTVRAAVDEEREPDSDRFDAILRRVELLLPGVADASRAQFETQVHAASADGLPRIGKTRLRNLFLNTAPGARDWVNACGAGKSIARIVSGLRPELSFAFTGM